MLLLPLVNSGPLDNGTGIKSFTTMISLSVRPRTATREVVPAEQAERLERARYEQDLASRLEWSAARQRLAAARNRPARALFDSSIAEAEFLHAIGTRP